MRARLALECAQGAAVDLEQCRARQLIDAIGEQAGIFRVWLGLNSIDFVPRLQWCVCVANTGVIANEPNLIEAVLRGCRRSYRYAAEDQDDAAAFGARYFGIVRETMDRAMPARSALCILGLLGAIPRGSKPPLRAQTRRGDAAARP